MKKVILATAIALSTTSALAAETAVLKVAGTLTNSACTPELSNGGVVDYGTIHLSELSAVDDNNLGDKPFSLTITCSADTKVAFTTQDNKNSTNAGIAPILAGGPKPDSYYQYGVGTTDKGVNIGDYGLWVTGVTVDGVTADSIISNVDLSSWRKGVGVRSDGVSNITAATVGSIEPLAFKVATFDMKANLVIEDTATLAITDDTKLDGQTTFTLKYI
ncbi:DUF1120 domain-containing protein [Enterobacter mori]|uniref:DUF1120 domain-containing protein n=1 Tax=Enterobacter mori TaxID=539813 RepID=UPI00398B19F2